MVEEVRPSRLPQGPQDSRRRGSTGAEYAHLANWRKDERRARMQHKEDSDLSHAEGDSRELLEDASRALPQREKRDLSAVLREYTTKAAFWGAVLLLGLLLVTSAVLVVFRHEIFSHRRQPRVPSSTKMGNFSFWAAVTGARYCDHVPRKIMARDGTIADVAVATMLCACVALPHRCGLGGGFFATYYNHSSRTAIAFNAREMAPAAATGDMYSKNSTLSVFGFRACAIPGTLKGYASLTQVLGSRVPWRDLFDDAIRLARDGIPVFEDLERQLLLLEPHIVSNRVLCEMLCSKLVNGSVLRVNETLRNPALADSLSFIAKNGDGAFYDGAVGRMLVKDIELNGGIITMEDVQGYYVEVTEALGRTLRDNVSVFVPPAPSGGPLLAFMIALMDSYRQQRPGGSGFSLDDSEETIHRFVEAIKFTYAKRMEIGDPGHIDMRDVLEELASESFLAYVRSKIRGTPFRDMRYYGVRYQKIESHGSGQIVILMPDGDALALMGSINGPFGALALSPSTGILLNNEMNDFAIPGVKNAFGLLPSHVNYIRPGKRPTSSISPLVMTDAQGDVTMVVSGTGAFSIITGAAQVVMRALWMNHTIKEAIDAPRVHHQLFPDEVLAEPNIDVDVKHGLKARGHRVADYSWYGTVVGISRKPGEIIHACRDYRPYDISGIDGD